MWGREMEYVYERGRVFAYEGERENMHLLMRESLCMWVWKRERKRRSLCMGYRKYVCACERERENMHVIVWGSVYIWNRKKRECACQGFCMWKRVSLCMREEIKYGRLTIYEKKKERVWAVPISERKWVYERKRRNVHEKECMCDWEKVFIEERETVVYVKERCESMRKRESVCA